MRPDFFLSNAMVIFTQLKNLIIMNLKPITHAALRAQLHRGVTQFAFKKLDGTLRTAIGTTVLSLIPTDQHPKGRRQSSDRTVVFFDVEKREWRSLSTRAEVFIA